MITWIIIILLAVLVLIGLSVLYRNREQHAAHSPSDAPYHRQVDSHSAATRHYNRQDTNPWLVDPEDKGDVENT